MNFLETNPIYESVCRDLGYRPVETRITFDRLDKNEYLFKYTTYMVLPEPKKLAIINPA